MERCRACSGLAVGQRLALPEGMTFETVLALSLSLLTLSQSQAYAASAPLELKWNELNPIINGHTVELTLPGTFTIKGEVAAIREDGLVLAIRRTSGKAFPEGNALIPRSAVIFLKLERGGNSGWHTMGTVIGVLSGVTLRGYVAAKTATSGGSETAVFLGTAAGISVAGLYAGQAVSKKATMIRVVQ